MKKTSFIIFALLSVTLLHAQGKFQKGYLIKNDGTRVECLIRVKDWSANPEEFRYKMNESDETAKVGSLQDVKEFGVSNLFKYKRYTVSMDRSTEEVEKLTLDRDPVNVEVTVFLRTLLEGKASLYSYERSGLQRFFYSTDGSVPQQLVYKKYLASTSGVLENELYKQQLAAFTCGGSTDAANTKYERKSMIAFFSNYNKCSGSQGWEVNLNKERSVLRFFLRPGITHQSFSSTGPVSGGTNQTVVKNSYNNKTSFRLGAEAEFSLPFRNNQWRVLVELAYQGFSTTSTSPDPGLKMEYKAIALNVGPRLYLPLQSSSGIYANVLYSVYFPMNSVYERKNASSLEASSSGSIALGLGYSYKNKYNLEIRYNQRDLLKHYFELTSSYTGIEVIAGISLFK